MWRGLILYVGDEASTRRISKAAVQRIGTKSGIQRLYNLPEWGPLDPAYSMLSNKARVHQDHKLIRQLEDQTSFNFIHPLGRKTAINLYHRVAPKIDSAAQIAGLPQSKMIVACLMLALSSLPNCDQVFQDDIEELQQHLNRRRTLLQMAMEK